MHLGPLLERAVRQIESDRMSDIDDDDEDLEDSELEKQLYDEGEEENTDEDYSEFYQHEEELKKQDNELYELMEGNE
jgi:hypothetical protein